MFPTPLAILIWFAPESPWWLVRKGRLDQAAKSVERLGRKSTTKVSETVAMMRRVIEMELSEKPPGYLELFKGVDLYRTAIVCGVYAAQNLTGNLIANQAVYFFERESFSLPYRSHQETRKHESVLTIWVLQRQAYQQTPPSPSALSPPRSK